jgi:DNA polymerase III delta subunit
MLRVYYGANTVAVRAAANEYVTAQAAAGCSVVTVSADTYELGILDNALGASSLFGERTCYVLDTPAEHPEYADALVTRVAECAASHNEFVLIAGVLSAAQRKQYTAHATSIQEYQTPPAEKVNHFALAEALATRDKKSLWLELMAARARGSSSEEIAGQLWWQLKALRLAALTSSAVAAGMSEYPYKKAKHALRHFKPGEVDALATSLLALYHDGHAGLRELDIALEAWVLQV